MQQQIEWDPVMVIFYAMICLVILAITNQIIGKIRGCSVQQYTRLDTGSDSDNEDVTISDNEGEASETETSENETTEASENETTEASENETTEASENETTEDVTISEIGDVTISEDEAKVRFARMTGLGNLTVADLHALSAFDIREPIDKTKLNNKSKKND